MGAGPRIDRLDRNLIINGMMEFWQRVAGATTTINDAAGGNTYTADRMVTGRAGVTVKNYSIVRSTDVPSVIQAGGRIPYAYQASCLTALGSPAASDVQATLQHRFEGYDYAERMFNKKLTLGMWVKLTAPSVTFPVTNFPIAFQTNTHSYVTHVTITANATWQFVTVTLDMGTFGSVFDNNLALRISIGSVAGSNYNAGSLNTWTAGDLFNHSTSFNFMGFNTNVLRVTGLTLIEGEVLNSGTLRRAGRSYGHELSLCQRYFELWTGYGSFNFNNVNSASAGSVFWHFKTTKRSIPVWSFGSTLVTNSRYYGPSGLRGITSVGPQGNSSTDALAFTATLASPAVQYQGGEFEIVGAASTDSMSADAEL